MTYTKEELEYFWKEYNKEWGKCKEGDIDDLSPFNAGQIIGYDAAFSNIKELLDRCIPDSAYSEDPNKKSNPITPQCLFEMLRDIRYDKNGTGQFSVPLKSEFTDYALHDIANKLYAKLNGIKLN